MLAGLVLSSIGFDKTALNVGLGSATFENRSRTIEIIRFGFKGLEMKQKMNNVILITGYFVRWKEMSDKIN